MLFLWNEPLQLRSVSSSVKGLLNLMQLLDISSFALAVPFAFKSGVPHNGKATLSHLLRFRSSCNQLLPKMIIGA